jgi:mannitol-1-/sugar-/sorbitol-6-phosphatase
MIAGLRITVDGRRPAVLDCAAVLLDMDGTLIDSRVCVERKWRRWCHGRGIDVTSLLAVSHGRQLEQTVRLAAPDLDVAAEVRLLTQLEESDTDGIVAVPGAATVLSQLPAGRSALVTSAWRRLMELRMAHAGLPVPGVAVTADDPGAGKPHPDGYLRAADQLGVEPEDCVVVEDSPVGLAAGRAAGMRTIALATTFGADELSSEIVIPDLTALTIVTR